MLTEKEFYDLMMASGGNMYNVTHISDFDGIASAAVTVYYTHMPLDNVLFATYPGGKLTLVHETLEDLHPYDSLVVFTDLSVSSGALEPALDVLRSLKSNNNTVAWVDHHPYDDISKSKLAELCDFLVCGENPKYCASELMYNILSRSGEGAKEIAATAHLTDFNLRNESNKDLLDSLSCAISFINYNDNPIPDLRKMVGIVSKCDFGNPFIRDFYSKYLAEAESNINSLKENARSFRAGDYLVGIGYGKHILGTAACAEIEEKFDADISIFIKTTSMGMSIRSKKGVDCSPIARALGGGGHPQASGASLPKQYSSDSKEGMEAAMEYVINTTKSIYKK